MIQNQEPNFGPFGPNLGPLSQKLGYQNFC